MAAVHACVHCHATIVMKYAKDRKSKQNSISIKQNRGAAVHAHVHCLATNVMMYSKDQRNKIKEG
ncbi:hypothetical protein GF594_13935 [Staphylococcus aureus]|nr:hypothetical protein [Staphylococcus aureus]